LGQQCSVFYYDLSYWSDYYSVKFWLANTGFAMPSAWWDKVGQDTTCYWAVLGYDTATHQWAVSSVFSFTKASGPCPAGTVEWDNGHCYEAVLAQGLSWEDAQADCEARGGYLATITSAEENAFVFSLVSGDDDFWFIDGFGNGLGPWLGGYQVSGSAEPDGGWRWVTDEPFDYTNWETGQPDNFGIGQDHLRFFKMGGLKGDRWDDTELNTPGRPQGYICEGD
jgi:hypothetical protein